MKTLTPERNSMFDDTRRDRAVELISDGRELIAEIEDEGPRDPHDRINLLHGLKLINAGLRAIRATAPGAGDA